MTSFSPKKLFQQNEPIAKDLQANRLAPWLVIGFTFTLSEMAFNGATAEQLAGARNFISTFQNLWEAGLDPVKLPKKELDMDKPSGEAKPEKK